MPNLEALRRLLATSGPTSGPELYGRLGISQSAFSRLIRRLGGELLMTGAARATRYALRREVPAVGPGLSVYRVDESGGSASLGQLLGTAPTGFYWEARADVVPGSAHLEDLPWWLHDLRPAGFLGRLIPRRHPELGLPEDIRFWSADHCLAYLCRHGWDCTGDLIPGAEAFARHIERLRQQADTPRAEYPRLAEDVLALGAAGSSAAGEQPKFLCVSDGTPVLVKFSPPLDNPVARRQADLLVCEHLAHSVLARHGQDACASELIERQDRIFLQVRRFDRVGRAGRRGVVSMQALDAAFVGRLGRWSESATELARQGIIPGALVRTVRWRELFGELIADTDMHPGNISFHLTRGRVAGLTPIYDTLPMRYSPRQGELSSPPFVPPSPHPEDGAIWRRVWEAALDFWRAVSTDQRISEGFRRIAAENGQQVAALEPLGRALPDAPAR